MSREFINSVCAGFPGAQVSDPFGGGHDAWKVGGKMFACIGSVTPGVLVKTTDVETAELLINAWLAQRAAYLHRSWVTLSFNAQHIGVTWEIAQRLYAGTLTTYQKGQSRTWNRTWTI